MARAREIEIRFSCGHEAPLWLTGSGKAQRAKMEWAEREGLCPECWRAKNRPTDQQVALAAQNGELPPLEGTEKQVAWAEDLRTKILAVLEQARQMGEEKLEKATGKHQEAFAAVGEMLDAAITDARRQTDARWWIDQRFAIENQWILFDLILSTPGLEPDTIRKAGSTAEQRAKALGIL